MPMQDFHLRCCSLGSVREPDSGAAWRETVAQNQPPGANRRGMIAAAGLGLAAAALGGGTPALAQAARPGNGAVVMLPDGTGGWVVLGPDGARLNTEGSRTSGLQEAMNFAASRGLAFQLVGGGNADARRPSPTIRCSETLRVPPLEETRWSLGAVTVVFDPTVKGDGILFDSLLHSTFEFHGVIHYAGDGAAVHVHPRNPHRGREEIFCVDNDIYIFRILIKGGTNPAGLRATADRGPMVHTRINLLEIEGGGDATTGIWMRDGIHLSAKSGAVATGNSFTVARLNQFSGAGLRIGDDDEPEARLERNRFDVHMAPSHARAAGIVTSGKHDYYLATLAAEYGPFDLGVVLRAQAEKSIFILPKNDGRAKLADGSRTRDSLFIPNQF